MKDKVLETERMILRRMEMADVDDLLGTFSDPVAMRHYPATKSRDETEGWARWVQGSYEKDGYGIWVATVKGSGDFAGQCGLVRQEVEGQSEVEIGYLFLRRLWGQGLATEAARACKEYGFDLLGFDRLVSLIAPDNLPSRRVAEKVGMALEREVYKWDRQICLYSVEKHASHRP